VVLGRAAGRLSLTDTRARRGTGWGTRVRPGPKDHPSGHWDDLFGVIHAGYAAWPCRAANVKSRKPPLARHPLTSKFFPATFRRRLHTTVPRRICTAAISAPAARLSRTGVRPVNVKG
jgi:hypothetical protein